MVELQKQLEKRREALRALIRDELLKADEERYSDLAGQVHDPEEASVADLLVDLNLTTIEKHVLELREVEDAQTRIRDGDYGTCVDCGSPIGKARLRAYPTAIRCIQCQDKWEKTHAFGGTPAL
ncbi:MAG TPA: TraR/DksA family transcriptional regulator [Chromatiaceae bacterium]|nr:TraR/DksA family transcriptional regulator [Chromatiaceae bacterium]